MKFHWGYEQASLFVAAWGYALGFAWRGVFGRIELLGAGKQSANCELGFVLPILIVALIAVVLIFGWALWLTWRQAIVTRTLVKGERVE